MSPRRVEFSRRAVRWLLPMALLALTPKCLFCVLAYAGIGAALGLGGPELCGAPATGTGSWPTMLALGGVALGSCKCLARHLPL